MPAISETVFFCSIDVLAPFVSGRRGIDLFLQHHCVMRRSIRAAQLELFRDLLHRDPCLSCQRTKTHAATAALLLAAGSSLAFAHHSWSADYDVGRSTHISGTVTRYSLRNPHSAVFLSVTAADGRQEHSTVEWGSPQRLRERGITDATLRVGDELLVTGHPHRDPRVKFVRALPVRRAADGAEIGEARGGR
jgi:hypothetical protein